MSIFDLSQTPNVVVMMLRGNTGVFTSPLTAAQQTIDRGGLHWILTYSFTNIRGDDRASLLGTLAACRSQANRLRVPVYDNPNRGLYGGTPVVAGASQTGSSIDIDGCSNNITNWMRKGDYFSIDVNGEHELKMCTADADTDGGGAVTLAFEPRLRASPLNNAALYVEDDVLPVPRGIFLLADPDNNWSSLPGRDKEHRSIMSLKMTEDVFATQP